MGDRREKEFIKNTLILSIGKILPKLTSFITLPILTTKLTKAEYGTYDLIATLVMLIIPLATLQIQSAAFRFLVDCRKNRPKASAIVTNIFVVTLPIVICASFIVQFFFREYSVTIRMLISAYFVFDASNSILGQIVRGIGKNKEYSFAATVVSVINMILVVFFISIGNKGLLGLMIAISFANFVGSVYLFLAGRVYRYINLPLISLDTIRQLLAYSWPMIPNNLSTWILKLSDRVVITAVLGIEANAVYAVANKIPNLLSMMQSVMVAAWHENASISVNDKDAGDYYSKMLEMTFDLMHAVTCILIAATPILFWLFIKGDYSEAYYQMPILILAMFFFVMSSFWGGIYIAHKKTKNVGISTLVAALINLGIDLALINIIGIWAGSISTLVSYIVLYYYRMFNSKNFQPIRVNYLKQGVQIAVLGLLMFLCCMRNNILNVLNVFLAVSFAFIFNMDIIIMSMKKVKSKLCRGE